jgi:hypothetical protein
MRRYIFCHHRVESAFFAVNQRAWLDAIVWLVFLYLLISPVRELVAFSDKDVAGIKLNDWSRVRPVLNDALTLPHVEIY